MDYLVRARVKTIETLINQWGKESKTGVLTDAQFIELCEEMADRGQSAADA